MDYSPIESVLCALNYTALYFTVNVRFRNRIRGFQVGNSPHQLQATFRPSNRPTFDTNCAHAVRASQQRILALWYELTATMLTDPGILHHKLTAIWALDMRFRGWRRFIYLHGWHHRHSDQTQWTEQQSQQKPDSCETGFAVCDNPAQHSTTDPDKKQNLHNFLSAKRHDAI